MSTTQLDPSGVIEELKETLQTNMSKEIWKLWFGPMVILKWELKDSLICLTIADRLALAHIKNNWLGTIESVLRNTHSGFKIILKEAKKPSRAPAKLPGNLPGMEPIRLRLPVDNTFEAFSVGEGNELAYEACKKVAKDATEKQPAPIFIHAPTGYGKSHLLYAVIRRVLKDTALVPTYVMTADFSQEMFGAIKTKSMPGFQTKYCASKMFLIDDVHMLEGKKKTQEELLLILKTLTRQNIPIVVTSTINPLDLEGIIREELLSLFISGIVAPIESAKHDNKSQIILHYAKEAELKLDEKIVDYLARTLNGDVRKITSIIYTLHSRHSLLGQNIDLALVENVAGKVLSSTNNQLTSHNILELVAGEFRISVKDIVSKSRKKAFTVPRHLIMWLAAKYTEETYELISTTVGRHHTSVNHAIKEVEKKLTSDTTYRVQVELLKARLKL
jgi:chromosomal replication initiator protein